MEELWTSVYYRLSVFLFECNTTMLRAPLHMQKTPGFSAAEGLAATTFKEAWDMINCVKSLRSNSLYEASMTIWQFTPAAREWLGSDLAIDAVSWKQLDSCAGLWSNAAFDRSSEQSDQRRYIFPGHVPTCVRSMDVVDVLANSQGLFKDLPACGGHAVLWSLIAALDLALSLPNEARVLKLYEASVTVTVRMRVAPSPVQLQLDALSYIDVLRVQNLATGATSFFEFSLAVLRMPEINGQETGTEMVRKLDTLGITYKGVEVGKPGAYSILAIVGIADQSEGKEAVRFLERISSTVFSDPTKIQRTIQVLKKTCASDECKDAFVVVMESMGVALLSGDAVENDFSVEVLVPKDRSEAGFVKSCITKRKFHKWFLDEQLTNAASGASSALSTEGLMLIKAKCSSPRKFWSLFRDGEMTEDLGVLPVLEHAMLL